MIVKAISEVYWCAKPASEELDTQDFPGVLLWWAGLLLSGNFLCTPFLSTLPPESTSFLSTMFQVSLLMFNILVYIKFTSERPVFLEGASDRY